MTCQVTDIDSTDSNAGLSEEEKEPKPPCM